MSYLGVFHADYSRSNAGVCDAPCITKGRMMLCGEGTALEGERIAFVDGRVRNRARLYAELGCPRDAEPARAALMAYARWGEDYPRHFEIGRAHV